MVPLSRETDSETARHVHTSGRLKKRLAAKLKFHSCTESSPTGLSECQVWHGTSSCGQGAGSPTCSLCCPRCKKCFRDAKFSHLGPPTLHVGPPCSPVRRTFLHLEPPTLHVGPPFSPVRRTFLHLEPLPNGGRRPPTESEGRAGTVLIVGGDLRQLLFVKHGQ